MRIYDNIIKILNDKNINYKIYEHWPILSYEDAEIEKQVHNWEWIESKNVFMTNKKWKYFLLITLQWKKVDFKQMKELTWEKLSLSSDLEVENIINSIPWCIPPFWFEKEIISFVDRNIFQYSSYLFSPWISTKTIELNPKDLKNIFLEKRFIFIN